MKKQPIFFIAIFVIAIFYSCGNAEKKTEEGVSEKLFAKEEYAEDSMPKPGSDTYKLEAKKAEEDTRDSIVKAGSHHESIYKSKARKSRKGIESDSVDLAPENATKAISPNADSRGQKEEGTLVYYCPGRMMENTDNNVSVTITKAAMIKAIDQLEERVIKTTGKQPELIKKDIKGNTIVIARKMKVELKYYDNDFKTIYKPESEDQIFDGTNDMNWDWIIRPTKVGTVQLSIIVSAYDEQNGRWRPLQTPPKIFNIKVQVDARGYFSKLWDFLEKDPEWLFVQIFIPLITFFFGRKSGKNARKKKT